MSDNTQKRIKKEMNTSVEKPTTKRSRSRSRVRSDVQKSETLNSVGMVINLPATITTFVDKPWNNLTIGFDSVSEVMITSRYLHDKILELDPFGESLYERKFWHTEEGEDAVWEIKNLNTQLQTTVLIRRPHILMRIRNIKVWNRNEKGFYLTINDFDKDEENGSNLIERQIEGQMDGGPRFGYLLPRRLRKFILSSHDKKVLPRAIFTIGGGEDMVNYCMLNIEWKMYPGCTDETSSTEPINYNIKQELNSDTESEGSEKLLEQDPAIIKIVDQFSESFMNLTVSREKTNEEQVQLAVTADTFSRESLLDRIKDYRREMRKKPRMPSDPRLESSTDLGSIPDVKEFRDGLSATSIPEEEDKKFHKEKRQKLKVKQIQMHIDCELASQSSISLLPSEEKKN